VLRLGGFIIGFVEVTAGGLGVFVWGQAAVFVVLILTLCSGPRACSDNSWENEHERGRPAPRLDRPRIARPRGGLLESASVAQRHHRHDIVAISCRDRAAAAVQQLQRPGVWMDGFTIAGIFVLLALGLNIVVGMSGLLDLGYAAFFAIGAYTYAFAASSFTHIDVPFWPMILIGAASRPSSASSSEPRR
jgi:hypothetical protein